MDKTEKRTAEDMYSNVVGRPGIHKDLPLHINATGEYLRKDIVLTAMQEYAAQELDAYKARLKKRITDWNSTSIEEVPPSYSWKDIFELIDTI